MSLGIADLLLVYESVDSKHGSCAEQAVRTLANGLC